MSKDVGQQIADAARLRSLFPYLRMYRAKTFVIKAGGASLDTPAKAKALLSQVAVLQELGIRVMVVHGGGEEASELSRALGLEVQFVDGRRITSDRALEVTTMVLNGSTNTRLLAAGRALGLRTVGISGVDSGLIQARRRPPVVARDGSTVDYGHVGDIDRVDPWLAERLLEDGAIPVVSPISADAAGALLNINADSVASALAIALKAVKLILVTEAAGLLDHPELPGSLISYTDLAGLARLKANGSVTAGMLPKLTAIERALEEGVPRAHIVSSQVPDSLLIEVFTNEGSGTLIVPELATLSSAEQAAP